LTTGRASPGAAIACAGPERRRRNPYWFDRVNVVSPGNTYFEGGIWQNIERGNPDLFKTAMSLNPTGRMGTAEEVAAGVVFLASQVASRVSGTNLIIDGALTKAV
jgi:3-oxoacyl-[acyl-carrier protein] reductase